MYIPGSVLHVVLTAKNERHVHPNVVKSHSPIFGHPFPIVRMDKFVFEFENVRVIRGYIERVCHHRGLHFSNSSVGIPVTKPWRAQSLNYNVALIITRDF